MDSKEELGKQTNLVLNMRLTSTITKEFISSSVLTQATGISTNCKLSDMKCHRGPINALIELDKNDQK